VVNYIDVNHGNCIILSDVSIVNNIDRNKFQGFWKIFFDGASSSFGLTTHVIFKNPQGECFPNVFHLQFDCTNC